VTTKDTSCSCYHYPTFVSLTCVASGRASDICCTEHYRDTWRRLVWWIVTNVTTKLHYVKPCKASWPWEPYTSCAVERCKVLNTSCSAN
jgi:hypothetical protein